MPGAEPGEEEEEIAVGPRNGSRRRRLAEIALERPATRSASRFLRDRSVADVEPGEWNVRRAFGDLLGCDVALHARADVGQEALNG